MLDEWDTQIFNKKAVIYIWKKLVETVNTLHNDKNYYAFLKIPPLQKNASDVIISLIEQLEVCLKHLL
jgi:hypothetical protein